MAARDKSNIERETKIRIESDFLSETMQTRDNGTSLKPLINRNYPPKTLYPMKISWEVESEKSFFRETKDKTI